MSTDFTALMEPVARLLLGEPNRSLSNKTELRYGKRGSLSVDLTKGTWFDHEANEGGGALDLLTRETKLQGADRFDWLRANGIHVDDDEPRTNGKHGPKLGPIVSTYDYVDETGHLLFQVTRHDPKDFRQRRPDRTAPDGWKWGVRGVRQVPYRLPDLIEHLDRVVFVVEGEKDADRLWSLGVPATTNAGGAGKWRAELSQFFQNVEVVVIPDYDPQKKHPKTGEPMFHEDGRPILPGQDHAQDVARSLSTVAASVRVLELWKHWPQMPLKGDVFDWLTAGHSADDLYLLVEQTPHWSPDQAKDTVAPSPISPPVNKRQFISGFVAPDYLVEGLLQRRFIYALTGQTGHAKTSVALLLAQLVSSTEPNLCFGIHRVAHGRVVYFVGENPDDVRMRVIGADKKRIAEAAREDDIWFLPGVYKMPEIHACLSTDTRAHGDVSLIIVDTSAAYFLGDEELNNVQMGGYARELRKLTTLPGGPTVLVLCHPIKHVQEPSQLLPRGGGAYLAEMDGNLTLWRKTDDTVELSYTKIRGPGFHSMSFRLESIPDAVRDSKDRPISTVRAVAISPAEQDNITAAKLTDEDHVLAEMLRSPHTEGGSVRAWASALGWHYGTGENRQPHGTKVQRILDGLARLKPPLVARERGDKWALTERGKDVARKAAVRFESQRVAAQQTSLDL